MHDLVKDKGSGLMMMGGYNSFGGIDAKSDWPGTPIADLLPVELEIGEFNNPVKMEPTAVGLKHYVMRLTDGDNKALWAKLPPLDGINRLGKPKAAASFLPRAEAVSIARCMSGNPMAMAVPWPSRAIPLLTGKNWARSRWKA